MGSELKACPFCGSDANLREQGEDWYIHCRNKKCGIRTKKFASVYHALSAWNSRIDTKAISNKKSG